ncbi:hypothetical protein P9112_012510 [Eukaryota sp. TZLM1-RC]
MNDALQTTTVGVSVNQFFGSEARERYGTPVPSFCLYWLQYPEHFARLIQSQFWSLCCDFVFEREPKQKRPIQDHPPVFQALQHLVQAHCIKPRQPTAVDYGAIQVILTVELSN